MEEKRWRGGGGGGDGRSEGREVVTRLDERFARGWGWV